MGDDMNMQIVLEAVDQSQEAFKGIDDALSGVQKLADDLSKAFDSFAQSINTSMGQASASMETLTKPLEDISRSAEDATKPFEDVAHAADDAKKAIDTITQSADDVTRSVDGISKAAIKIDAQQADDALNSIVKGAEEAQKAIETLDKTPVNPGGHGGSGHGEGGLFGIQGQMDTMYAGMSLGAMAAPIDAGLGASIDQFAQFDQSMRLVNQEMGLSQTGFQNLEQAVLSLSNSTGISAQDLSAGLYNVVASGVTNTSDALTMLQTAAEGAKAGNTDLNTATKALNAVMGAYGMNAKDAGNIMDVMFTAVNNGQMHFDDLAKSVGASATSAASAGVSYTELAAAQATLTNVGKNAESASQNLNSLIMGMIAPTAGATKEAKSLGIEWDAQALKAHGLSYMINEAVKATHGNSEELKKLVPNQRAYMAVLALGSNAHKEYTDTLNKMKDAHGATAAALEEYDKGAGDAIEKMKTSIVNAGISLGATFAPAITKVTDAISKLAQWFSNLSPSTKEFIGIMTAVIGGILTLGAGFFLAISGIGAFVSGLKTLQEAMKAASIAEALMDALNPAGWILLAIVAVAALAAALITYWGPIKAFAEKTFQSIKIAVLNAFHEAQSAVNDAKTKISEAMDKMREIISKVKDKFIELKNDAIDKTKEAFKNLQDKIKEIKDKLNDFKDQVVDAIKKKFDDFNKTLKDHQTAITVTASILGTIFGPALIKTGVQAGIAGVQIATQFIANIVKSGTEAIVAGAKLASGFIANIIKSGAEGVATGAKLSAQFIVNVVKAGAEAVVAGGKLSAQFIANVVKAGAEAVVAGGKLTAQFIASIIKAGAEAVVAGVKITTGLIASIITLGVESVLTAGKITGQAIVAMISYAAEGWLTTASIVATTAALVANGVAVVAQKVALAASTVATGIATAAQWAFNAALDANPIGIVILAIAALGFAIYELCKHFDDIKMAVEKAWDTVKTKFDNLVQEGKNWGANLIHMFAQGVSNTIHEVEDAVSNAAKKVASFLGFHSPTEDGPAADSDTWAPNFVKMFAGGISKGAGEIAKATNDLIAPLGTNITGTMNHSVAMAGAYGQSASNGATVINITVSGNVTKNEQELADRISAALYKKAKVQGKF